MPEVHVASVKLYVAKGDIDSVADCLRSSKNADLAQLDRNCGEMTVVLETRSMKEITSTINCMKRLQGVASANLIFHNMVNADAPQAITA